jgi:type I restriction enzyme, R subunit
MRDVKSRNYFEQMKGRGTRVIGEDDLKKVTRSAQAKTHFVIVDAVGVTRSLKTDSRPLERKRTVPLKDLLMGVMMGAQDEDTFSSLASRLTRLERQMESQEKERLVNLTGGHSAGDIAKALLWAYDPDAIADRARVEHSLSAADEPSEAQIQAAQQILIEDASSLLTGEIVEYLDNLRREHEQIIDTVNLDTVNFAGWDIQATEQAEALIGDFREFIETHKDEITALKIFYNLPYQYRAVTYLMIEELLEVLKTNKPHLLPLRVWQAYKQVEQVKGQNPFNELTALVALVRRVVGLDSALTPYESIVNRNFQEWVFKKQAGALKFTEEQMTWLRMIKEHIASSFHLEREDLDYSPFDRQGGVGKMYQLFGEEMDTIIQEINQALVA